MLFVYLLIILFLPISTVLAQSPTITIEDGTLTGTGTNIWVFKGIPYAVAPIGDLRWKPPIPFHHWKNNLQATKFGCACPQSGDPKEKVSEDCLTLNIWAPAPQKEKKLPVMVWIHGGGFQSGSSVINGEELAKQGAVLVSINYRLGILGFFAHPQLTKESPHHSSGNYGLLDQIAALQWVKKNISVFGGDTNRITVFGESAGATSIGYLLTSPLSKGLFQRAILESASRLGMPDVHLNTNASGLTAMQTVGLQLGTDITKLRSLPASKLIDLANRRMEAYFGGNGIGKLGLRPESHVHLPSAHDRPYWAFADGWIVPEDLSTLWDLGKQHKVQLLIGTNADEGSIFLLDLTIRTVKEYKQYLQKYYSPEAKKMFQLYPANNPDEIQKAINNIITDGMFLYGSRQVAKAGLNSGSDVYMYRFTHLPVGFDPKLGVFHGAEMEYVFGKAKNEKEATPTDLHLSQVMMRAWVNFATSGNPNGPEVPQWPKYEKNQEDYLELGDTIRINNAIPKEKLNTFSKVFKTY